MANKQIIPYSDPYYLGSSDSSTSQLGSIIFDGTNYLNWSRSIRMALGAKNKLGFIDGKVTKLGDDSEDLSKWIRNDYMIRFWLFESISPQIADQMMLFESAKMLCEDLQERYGQTTTPQLYLIKKEVTGLLQNDMTVGEYYRKLKRYQDELNNLDGILECECEAMKNCTCKFLKRMLEREAKGRVMDFLMGLNAKYKG